MAAILLGWRDRKRSVDSGADSAHEAVGDGVEEHFVAERFLLGADLEIQGLEREGFAPVEDLQHFQHFQHFQHARRVGDFADAV